MASGENEESVVQSEFWSKVGTCFRLKSIDDLRSYCRWVGSSTYEGNEYEGVMENGDITGFGMWTYNRLGRVAKFVGSWDRGEIAAGKGIMFFATGCCLEANFQAGGFVKCGTLFEPDSSTIFLIEFDSLTMVNGRLDPEGNFLSSGRRTEVGRILLKGAPAPPPRGICDRISEWSAAILVRDEAVYVGGMRGLCPFGEGMLYESHGALARRIACDGTRTWAEDPILVPEPTPTPTLVLNPTPTPTPTPIPTSTTTPIPTPPTISTPTPTPTLIPSLEVVTGCRAE